MAAKLTPRVQHLVAEVAELSADELAALVEAIRLLPAREVLVPDRHAVIAERVARVHAGDVTTLSVEDVERSIRRDLDF